MDRGGTGAGGLAQEMAELALKLHEEKSLEDTVERVLEFAVKALDCAHAGVILVHKGGRVETLAATDGLVAELDQVQLETGEGPDIDMMHDRYGVLVEDAEREPRWPRWAKTVAGLGIRSMVGVRLHTSATTLGSLNLYDPAPERFDLTDQAIADLLARHAAVAMDTANESVNLWRAIDARKVVGQAQGILMERFDINADQAFAVLRRYSQDHNIKLHTIAERLIADRRLPG